jgi:hypothetical protein
MKKDNNKKVERTPNENKGILLNGVKESEVPNSEYTDHEEIQEAFGQSIEYEEISEIETSPMNEPVKVGEVSEGIKNEIPIIQNLETKQGESEEEDLPKTMMEDYSDEATPPSDAPEQPIDEAEEEQEESESKQSASSSHIDQANDHAKFAADSMLGVANNLLAVGGNFFVKIKKRKSHIYFDELIERIPTKDSNGKIGEKIDIQNDKNIKRIVLDKADIALLRPIIIQVLKQHTKQLTPEQQLIAIGLSIVAKKAQMVMEMRAENALFIQNLDRSIESQIATLERLVEINEQGLNQQKDVTNKEEKKAA